MIKKWPLIGMFAAFFLFSCVQNSAGLKDGYYTAEAAEFDDHGWKEYVTIYVSSGKILTVEYNAFNISGFIKSWDMDYMRIMNREDGIYPNAYARLYAGQLISQQGVEGIDSITGATNSYKVFKQLAGAAIENARLGNSAIGFVTIAEAAEDVHQTGTN
ncbi:hypothetical protein AGMMS49546_17400 [Spirochaetia bacterium]|nr:hypothetical protein AGMMS49546_17400 [Spirochaetia bacterium]